MPVLSAHHLRKTYGAHTVVDGVNFTIEKGQCFGLLGPNGAVKTTTLRLLLGLIEPDAGQITMLGREIPRQAREARQRVGVVPQMDNLDPDFSVTENFLVYGRYFGLSVADIAARIPGLLDFAGLTHRADAKIQDLSGGMKRRLTLARALVNDPDLIFLDEPTTGLDPQARHLMWQGLRRLLNQGKTIVLTTHFMEEAERLCDRLVILDHGRLIAEGAPRELIAQHIEPCVTEIYGDDVAHWRSSFAAQLCERHEYVGETLFCYSPDGTELMQNLHAQPKLRYLHRPASLEDVFLKLTGRELRD
jgi:lipooligosaccharide transport system ATP-binding protein